MKHILLLVLISFAGNVSFAQAISQPTPVTDVTLKLIGKGIKNSKTKDSIAIACVGEKSETDSEPSCDRIRHVFFEAKTQSAYFIGPEIDVHIDTTQAIDQQMEQFLKNRNKNFKIYKRIKHRTWDKAIYADCGIFAVTSGIFLAHQSAWLAAGTTLMGMNPVGAGILIVLTASLGTTAIFFSNRQLFNTHGGWVTAVYDKNGWNWSSSPRKVRDSAFRLYQEFITQPSSVQEDPESDWKRIGRYK